MWAHLCSFSRRTCKQESSSHEGSSEDESDDDNDVSWFHFTTMAAQINVLLSLIYDKLPENKLIIWILFRCWAINSYSFDLGTCKEGCCQTLGAVAKNGLKEDKQERSRDEGSSDDESGDVSMRVEKL